MRRFWVLGIVWGMNFKFWNALSVAKSNFFEIDFMIGRAYGTCFIGAILSATIWPSLAGLNIFAILK